jgi:hypothetical protein
VDRPGGLTVVAASLLVIDLVTLGAALLAGIAPEATGTKVFAFICAAGVGAIIWRFWMGRNSARMFLMALAGFLILNALMGGRVEHGTYLYMIALAAVGIFLLFYVNRPEVRSWFRSQNEAAARKNQ